MSAGQGFAAYEGGRVVETGVIPQWAFPGAHPASLNARAFRKRILSFPVPDDPAIAAMRAEMIAYCDQQIAAVERQPFPSSMPVGPVNTGDRGDDRNRTGA